MAAAHRCRARASRRGRTAALLGVLASVALSAARADADAADVIDSLRVDGCEAVQPLATPARRDGALDAAARELARGATLEEALGRVGYPVASSTSFHVRGSSDDAVIRRMLAERYCAVINDAAFAELGVHQAGADTWIVMAGRTAVPFAALRDPRAVAERVLVLVNEARAQAQRCGSDLFEAAAPLTMSTTLTAAASLHSLDMAARERLGHDGSDGSVAGDRITRAGYEWRASGENVAAGQPDAPAVVAGWLKSPGHCATLMNPAFTEMGVAFALAPDKNPPVYWTQVFAAPR